MGKDAGIIGYLSVLEGDVEVYAHKYFFACNISRRESFELHAISSVLNLYLC